MKLVDTFFSLKKMNQAGLDYNALEAAFKDGSIRNKLEPTKAPTDDIDEIVKLIEEHFSVDEGKTNEVKMKGMTFFN